MKVREALEILATCDPEAEVLTCTGRSLFMGGTVQGTLILPTRDVEPGWFPKQEGVMSEGAFVMFISTDAWGISPRKREGLYLIQDRTSTLDVLAPYKVAVCYSHDSAMKAKQVKQADPKGVEFISVEMMRESDHKLVARWMWNGSTWLVQ